jgi:hypothetical protein
MSATAVATTPYQAALNAVAAKGGKITTLPPAVKTPAQKAKSAGRAKAEVATQKKATQKRIDGLAKGMTGGGGPVARLTTEWLSTKKRDVLIDDRVKLPNGTVIEVIGRWTRKTKDGALIPMVTGHIVSGAPEGKKVGDRQNAVAAEATHTTAARAVVNTK